jgi:hypothetical protein
MGGRPKRQRQHHLLWMIALRSSNIAEIRLNEMIQEAGRRESPHLPAYARKSVEYRAYLTRCVLTYQKCFDVTTSGENGVTFSNRYPTQALFLFPSAQTGAREEEHIRETDDSK